MKSPLAPEEIYDALADDALFVSLPRRLAEALGGRSLLMMWHFGDGSADVLAHSGYFSDVQLQLYAAQFAQQDPWAAATASQPQDVAADLETYVSAEAFAASAFYNDYIRAIGDDTFRCMGIRSNTPAGSGMIAVQRGRGQPRFSNAEVRALGRIAPHLRRLLVLRGRMQAERRQRAGCEAILHAMRDAALLADGEGRLAYANAAGGRLLKSGRGLLLDRDTLVAERPDDSRALLRAISEACGDPPRAGCVTVACNGWPPSAVSVSPLRDGNGGRRALLLVHERDAPAGLLKQHLQALFGLTPGEADIAVRVGSGATVADIAVERGASPETVRGQLKALFGKIGCSRQAELALLVRSIPVPGGQAG